MYCSREIICKNAFPETIVLGGTIRQFNLKRWVLLNIFFFCVVLFCIIISPRKEWAEFKRKDLSLKHAGFGCADSTSEYTSQKTAFREGFVYVAEFGPLIWPSGQRSIRSFRVCDKGTAQYVERTGVETAEVVRSGEVNSTKILETLSSSWPKEHTRHSNQSSTDIIREDHPGYIFVCLSIRGEPVRFWQGDETTVPKVWQFMLQSSWPVMANLPLAEQENVAAWFTAELLQPETATEKKSAGVMEVMAYPSVREPSLLWEAFSKPYLVIPIPPQENPFVPLGWTGYTAGRSIGNFEWANRVYQVYPMHKGPHLTE